MKYLKTFLSAILAGLCVSIGGVAFLSVENRVIGALLFTVGLFTICTFGFSLFTGKVCYALQNDVRRYSAELLIIWIGNLAGAWLTAALVRLTRIAPISERAADMCNIKLNDSLLSLFILGVFCNMLIYIAVEGYKKNPHELGRYLSLFFGVAVFILCGFEHSVADMFYFSVSGMWSGDALLRVVVISVGNAAGGILFAECRRYFELKKQ